MFYVFFASDSRACWQSSNLCVNRVVGIPLTIAIGGAQIVDAAFEYTPQLSDWLVYDTVYAFLH